METCRYYHTIQLSRELKEEIQPVLNSLVVGIIFFVIPDWLACLLDPLTPPCKEGDLGRVIYQGEGKKRW